MAIGQWAEDYLDGGKSAGGGAGGIVCELTYETGEEAPVIKATMTAGELWTALQNGSSVLFYVAVAGTEMFMPLLAATHIGQAYNFGVTMGDQTVELTANTASDHPSNGGGPK